MQRYFVEQEVVLEEEFHILSEDIHHIKKVMRNKIGDTIICIDSLGHNYLCEILDVDTGTVQAKQGIVNDSELDVKVTLLYALPKGDKFEWVLQKATELGVHTIIPLLTKRCVIRTNAEKFQKKKQRYQKIVKEASEQSYRNRIPTIRDVVTIKELPSYQNKHAIVAYEEDAKNGEFANFSTVLNALKKQEEITIVVGPEGGFDSDEITQLQKLGFSSCSLGKRILRSETAPIYMLSVIGYMRELRG